MNGQERLNSPPKLGGVPARPSSSKKGRAGGVVPKPGVARFCLGTTPSAPPSVASRHFLNGAATPPNLGGESSGPQFIHDFRARGFLSTRSQPRACARGYTLSPLRG